MIEIQTEHEIPEGHTLLEAVILATMLDPEGEVCFGMYRTDGMFVPEAVGLMQLNIAEAVAGWTNGAS